MGIIGTSLTSRVTVSRSQTPGESLAMRIGEHLTVCLHNAHIFILQLYLYALLGANRNMNFEL